MVALPGIAILSKIYESSNSLVYRGISVQYERALVIKMLKQDYPSPQELTRYRQEYKITRFLKKEGVVKAYSQQEYQRTLVIFLEDFGGESLEKWRHKRSDFCPMSLSTFLRLAIDITDILGKIHAANVIHKDINPGNIVFNPDTGVVKIIDFGIATQFNRTNPTFKSPHVLEGTLAYLSPEQTGRMNRFLDYRTDFYSLGVTFYELLTGHLPFPTTDTLELVHCHIAKQPIPPHELKVTIPKTVSDIILKLMAKNAEERYQSAWGIKADLEICLRQFTEIGQIDTIQLALQDVSEQFQIPQKLYGREQEVALLLSAFSRVGYPEYNGVAALPNNTETKFNVEMMLVSGYAGIGKSALVQEIYKPITQKRGYFISGKFDQFGRNIPYSAIAHALQKLVQQLLGEPDEHLQQWRSSLLTALGSNGQIIIDVIPEVELIIGKQPPVPEVGATEAQNRFNRVFGQFIRVFGSAEHLLVIFLDDLQWVDSATLKLIELMMTDTQTQYLFLIGAYRDNEVNYSHPLAIMLEGLRKEGATISQITLAPLGLNVIAQMIADTLHSDISTIISLAELVLRKTGGNPFFVNEFLKTLYAENLLSFDLENLSWRWDITHIEAKNITDNVVELMLSKLKKLPQATQQVLQFAACVGADFDLSTLSIICKSSSREIFPQLIAAAQSGLIVPTSELDEQLLVQDYKFLHDRVQQAAYVLIDRAQRQAIHLQIGRNLLEKTESESLSDWLFEIVDHLNHGIELVTERAERDEIAKLNLLAGQKAKAAIAYGVANKYLATGRDWLAASSWQINYDLTLRLYTETIEVAYLCGDFEQVKYWAAIVLQEAETVLDTVKVYEVKIQTFMAQSLPLKAINTALQVLQQMGISFPETPSQLDIRFELNTITSLFSEKQIANLLYLSQMTEPNHLAAIRILSSITIAAYIADSDLMPLLMSKQVNLLMQYGNTFMSPFVYANFGWLCGISGDIESGYQFGQVALGLLSQSNTHSLRARTLAIVNQCINPWKKHIGESLKLLLEGYQSGLETGDLEYAAYCAHAYCLQFFILGKELVEVEREMTTYSEAIRQIRQETVLAWNRVWQQAVLNLMGYSANPCCLIGESYNEEIGLPQHKAANDRSSIFIVYFNKLFLCYLLYKYSQAVENSIIAERYLIHMTASPGEPLYYLYDSLARLATYSESSTQVQEEILKKVVFGQEKMKSWAHHAPMNYLHKYHLLEAEKARVLGQLLEAEGLYEQAIRGARENGYIQEEALAYELAARHYLARDLEKFAQIYMKEAHYCYERWGAVAKVKDLEMRYPQFFPQQMNVVPTPVRTTGGSTSITSHIAFDLATVIRALQAISREIELEQLLRSLMQILIENAGAQIGFLILEKSGKWTIEANCELAEGESVATTQVLQSIPTANCLPESIIQYVIRTHESVILNNATHEGNFINDSYIQRYQPQSVLCLPLLNLSKLVGVLYLENQLAAGAFTPERAQVLHLLSTQAATAIENARLYSKLLESESKMTQFMEAMPVGVAVANTSGRLFYFNHRATQLLGKDFDLSVTPNQIAEEYQLYIAGTDQKYLAERIPIIRALRGERIRVDDMEIHRNNATIPIEVWATPVFDEQGNVSYAIATFEDITERKQAEKLLADYNRTLEQQVAQRTAALQKSEAQLRDVYDELRLREQELRVITDAIPVCITYIDANQRYRFANRTYEEWFGCSRGEIRGKHICENLGEAAYQVVQPYINQALAGQVITYESEISCVSGKKYISNFLIPDFDGNGQVKGYYGLITDISDRKRAEEASILEERNRMAREIHDTLAQAFTGILVQVGAAIQVLEDDSEATQTHLDIIDELARIGLSEARRSVTALRPQLLEEGDLSSALNRLVMQMRSATDDTVLIYEIQGTAYSLPAEVENNLLRIGQEALTNAIKYAKADEIRLELVYADTLTTLCIKDNGQGFGVGSTSSVGGFGLLGMSERAERIGAQLRIESQLGQGTEIIVIVNRG
ncbi:AAA family ATPase [Leptolyngbya sp. FACHB-671]|uniref:AAA family ATPase n=1 Tax=Leptolyngbya sp. FACHB-671 TaxID=2692812 RepID=UPI00168959A4|nr:AAA family ATPase [Leptolyngbya sp. FACHB-671]MBD2067787.1 AAA family ATPase [Leptolyngbya sp. FACHB-671]